MHVYVEAYSQYRCILVVLCVYVIMSVVAHGTFVGTDKLRNQDFSTGLRLKLSFCRHRYGVSLMMIVEDVQLMHGRRRHCLVQPSILIFMDECNVIVIFMFYGQGWDCVLFSKWSSHLNFQVFKFLITILGVECMSLRFSDNVVGNVLLSGFQMKSKLL